MGITYNKNTYNNIKIPSPNRIGSVSIADKNNYKPYMIREIRKVTFNNEHNAMLWDTVTSSKSKSKSLNLFLDANTKLRRGGR